MAEINPSSEEVAPNVPALREEFKKKYEASISGGTYDSRDVERLEKDDSYARAFLRTLKSKNNVSLAVEVINECFIFRKENGIWDLTEESFPEEVKSKNGIYFKGQDVKGFKVLYIDVSANSAKNDEERVWIRKYAAFVIEQHHRNTPEEMVTCLFDMHKASTFNFSPELSKYFTTCFAVYFPCFLSYMINYEMPFILGAAFSLVTKFLSAEQNKKIIAVNKSKIKTYLPEDNLWDCMK